MYDVVLNKGFIVDGTGKEGYLGSVGIKDGRIAAVSKEMLTGKEMIDCTERVIAPGFIDIHSHGDFMPFLKEPYSTSRLLQGVTTEIVGMCGISPLPYVADKMEGYKDYIIPLIGDPGIPWSWSRVANYKQLIKGRMMHNALFFVGHSALRAGVAGMEHVTLDKEQLKAMGNLYEQSLNDGAVGLSLGLSYLPGVYGTMEELLYLGEITKKHDALIMAHIRSHNKTMIEAMEEFGQVGLQTGARIHISHCRSYGNREMGISPEEIIGKIEELRARGCQVTVDQHPYTAGSTFLNQLIPPEYRGDGKEELVANLKDEETYEAIKKVDLYEKEPRSGWDNFIWGVGLGNIMIASLGKDENKKYVGKTLVEIGEMEGKDPFKALADILISENGEGSMVIQQMFTEEDISKLLKVTGSGIGSDGLPVGLAHPRLYGAFPKVLGTYVRDKGVLTLPEGIYQMTGFAREILPLEDRGLIKEGLRGDIVVFDPKTIGDQEDYVESAKQPLGIDYVFLGGHQVVEKGTIDASKRYGIF